MMEPELLRMGRAGYESGDECGGVSLYVCECALVGVCICAYLFVRETRFER